MRLIDADALKKEIHSYALDAFCINLENSKEFAGYSITENYCEGLYEATELIDYAPTIDAEPVRHGRWVNKRSSVYCSRCDKGYRNGVGTISALNHNYCPNRGAKMGEVSE